MATNSLSFLSLQDGVYFPFFCIWMYLMIHFVQKNAEVKFCNFQGWTLKYTHGY